FRQTTEQWRIRPVMPISASASSGFDRRCKGPAKTVIAVVKTNAAISVGIVLSFNLYMSPLPGAKSFNRCARLHDLSRGLSLARLNPIILRAVSMYRRIISTGLAGLGAGLIMFGFTNCGAPHEAPALASFAGTYEKHLFIIDHASSNVVEVYMTGEGSVP